MIPELILIALLFGWIFKGKFDRLADANIRFVWLIYVPLAFYLVSWMPAFSRAPWFLGTFALVEKAALVVVTVSNIRMPGMKLALAGVLLNVIALAANGGLMPMSHDAVITQFGADFLEKTRTAIHVRNVLMDTSTELGFLCDIIAAKRMFLFVPAIYSIGDLVMSAGIFTAIIAIMRTPLPGEKRKDAGEPVGS